MEKVILSVLMALVLLDSVAQSEAQSQECAGKIHHCGLATVSLQNITSQPPAVVRQICDSVVGQATKCLNEAESLCKSNTDAMTTVNGLRNLINAVCSEDGQLACQNKLVECQKPYTESSQSSSPDLGKMCTIVDSVILCLNKVSGCQAVVQQTLELFQKSKQAVCSSGVCMPAMGCITSSPITSITDAFVLNKCSGFTTLVNCMDGKKGDCKFPEGKITLASVYNNAQGFCTEASKFQTTYSTCQAANVCVMQSPEMHVIPELASQFTSADMSSVTEEKRNELFGKVISQFSNSTFLCQLFEVMARCYVQHVSTCKYSAAFNASMTAQHHIMMDTCAGKAGSTGGSDQLTAHTAHWLLAVVTTVLVSLKN